MQLSFFETVTTDERPEPCPHEVKEWAGLVGRCVDCKQVFYACYKWDGTELGAYRPVYSHPLPEGMAHNAKLVFFLECCALLDWHTSEDGFCTPYGGHADILQTYKSFYEWFILLPF